MSEVEQNPELTPKKKSKAGQFIAKWGGLFFLIAMIAVIIILAVKHITFGQWLANLVIIFWNDYGKWGIYLGVALISVFGNFTVIFPVPGFIVAFATAVFLFPATVTIPSLCAIL